MEEKFDSIADFDLNMICNFFRQLDRQGPGSIEETKRALTFIRDLPGDAKIIDLGCGTGGQTVTLACNVTGKIIAVDFFPGMIEFLNKRISEKGLKDRIEGVVASMKDIPFAPGMFDLIWAEGSIYNIGFEKGLNEWRKYLKEGGYIAVTEATWLTSTRPPEIEKFWNDNYPEIDTVSNKVRQMEEAGYKPVATFILPESCWTDNFYYPMADLFEQFLKDHNYREDAVKFIERQKEEIVYYEKYKEYYGYVFYIGQKSSTYNK